MVLVVATWIPEEGEDPPDDQADVLEVRLDALDVDQIPPALEATDRPVLAACRREADGGVQALDEDERAQRLQAALDAGAQLVDVEHDAPFLDALARRVARADGTLVVSDHLEHTPQPATILDRLRSLAELGDVAKLATAASSPEDAHALLEAGRRAPAIGTPFTLMGVGDSLARALAGPMGQALVYAAPDEDPVPGQLPTRVQARLPRHPPTPSPQRAHVLIGHPVGHSLSPPMQEAGFEALGIEARYGLIDAEPDELATVLDGLAVPSEGGNVTSPHKTALYEAADEATDVAHAVGAANTFRFEEDRLLVHMTDGLGAHDALQREGVELAGRHVLVLGAGGTASAVAHALSEAGARLSVANRTRKRAEHLAEDVDATVLDLEPEAIQQALGVGDVVVNATPVDPPVPDDALAELVAFDANYGHRAAFAHRARQAGAHVLDGLDLLVAQGVRSLAFWTGEDVDEATRGRMSTVARTRALDRRYREDPG